MGIETSVAFQGLCYPCSNDHPKCHHATVKSARAPSSHLPIMVNPVGHSKFPGREPIATETQLRTRAQNERLWDNTLTRSTSGNVYLCELERILGSYLFLPSKDILLALGAPESVCQVPVSLGQFSTTCYAVH